MAAEAILDRDAFARWFGEHCTTRKYPDIDWRPEEPIGTQEILERLAGGTPLSRNPASRFSFIRRGAQSLSLFVDGRSFDCTGEAATLAERLCAQDAIRPAASDSTIALLAALIAQGSIAFEPED